jgi:hypothetical protein
MKLIQAWIELHQDDLMADWHLASEKHHLPHIHIRYQGYRASVAIDDAALLAGELPPRQLRMVQVWVDLHREELLADWELAKEGVEPFRIDPLK